MVGVTACRLALPISSLWRPEANTSGESGDEITMQNHKLTLEQTAARMKEVRDEIFDALEDIPSALNSAQRVLMIYKDSEKLQVFNSILYVSILKALGHILGYFRDKPALKFTKAIFKQSTYAQSLSLEISNIKKCRDAFNREAATCQTEMIKKTHDVSSNTNKNTQQVAQRVEAMKQFVEATSQEQQHVLVAFGDKLQSIEHKVTFALNQVIPLFLASPRLEDMAWDNCEHSSAMSQMYILADKLQAHR